VHRSASSGGALALRRHASVHAAYERCRDQLRSARLVRRHKRTCGTLPHLDSGLVGIEPYCRVVPAVDEHVRADQDVLCSSASRPPRGRSGASRGAPPHNIGKMAAHGIGAPAGVLAAGGGPAVREKTEQVSTL